MEERTVLYFNLLGSFMCREAYRGETKNSVVPDKIGKKALSFLQYLIVNHTRNISSEEPHRAVLARKQQQQSGKCAEEYAF